MKILKYLNFLNEERKSWDEEKVREEAKKYKTRSDFKSGCPGAYNWAAKHEIVDTLGFEAGYKSWDEEKVREEAKKYKTRSDFKSRCPGAYNWAAKHEIVDTLGFDKVLITWDEEKVRAEAKKYKTRFAFKEGCVSAYDWAAKHKIMDTLGFDDVYKSWDEEKVREEAKKYKTRSDFKSGCVSAYSWASRHEIMDTLGFDDVYITWDEEKVRAEAKKYKTRFAFQVGCASAYAWAAKHKLLDTLGFDDVYIYRDNKTLIGECDKYDTVNKLVTDNINVYKVINRRGLKFDLYGPGSTVWNKERIQLIADNFDSIESFKERSPIAYRKANELKINIDSLFKSNVKSIKTKTWTRAELEAEAKLYTNKAAFRKRSPSAASAADDMGIFHEITKHMKDTPKEKAKVFTLFKTIFPDGHTHYARFSTMKDNYDYLGYCVSQSKNRKSSSKFLDKIRNTDPEEIEIEVVKTDIDEDQSYFLMIGLAMNDKNSINSAAKFKKKIADYSAPTDIEIPKDEYIKHDNEYYIKSSYYNLNRVQYKDYVDLKQFIKNPKNDVTYYKIKSSYRVVIPGGSEKDNYKQLTKSHTKRQPDEADILSLLSGLSGGEMKQKLKELGVLRESIFMSFDDFVLL